MSSDRRHACVVPFPELAELVEPWLEHSVGPRPSHGIPPHVTLLVPSPPRLDDVLDDILSFDVEFRSVRRFPDVVYLEPEPAQPFVDLTESLWRRFPDWPPYGGAHETVTPHLTVAWGAQLDEAEADIAPRLPVRARAREAVLLRQEAPERWEIVHRYPFQGA